MKFSDRPKFGDLIEDRKEEVKKEIALSLLSDGMAVEQVVKHVELPVKEVKKLNKH